MSTVFLFLTTILSSGLVAAIISFSFSEAKERWLLRRSKIEEIYLSAATWIRDISIQYMPYLRVCQGSMTYNQMLDIQIKGAREDTGAHKLKMKMNIEMYEPSLGSEMRDLETEIARVNEVTSKVKQSFERNGQASECLDLMRAQLLAFDAAGERLLEAIIRLGARVGAEKGQAAQLYQRIRQRIN